MTYLGKASPERVREVLGRGFLIFGQKRPPSSPAPADPPPLAAGTQEAAPPGAKATFPAAEPR